MKQTVSAAELLAQLLHGAQLSRYFGQVRGGVAVVELRAFFAERLLGGLEGLLGSHFVDVAGTGHGVGENLHHVRLHFEEAARDVEHLLLATLLDQPDGTRLQIGDQGGVARGDTKITQVAVRDHHLDQTGEDLRLGTDDVAMDCYGHTLASRAPVAGRTGDYSFLAFSMASSMLPTM